MRVLVTGGAGFIGSHYVRSLLGDAASGSDISVTVLDALTYAGNTANLDTVAADPRFTFVHGDICDAGLVTDLLSRHDVVVNFAAASHVDRSITDGDEFVRTNVLGVQNLLRCALAAKLPRFVQVSTDEVYGSIESGSWTEDAPVRPSSVYSASKAGADLLCLAYVRTHGLNVSITRCGNNYGPYQYPEKVIPLFVTNLLTGKRVPLYGDGRNRREWLHIDDHCRAIRLVVERGGPGEIYHVAGGGELTNRELTGRLLELCGAGWDAVEQVPDRKGHDFRYSLDDGKLRALGYRPRVELSEGLADTVRWYREHREWWAPLTGAEAVTACAE